MKFLLKLYSRLVRLEQIVTKLQPKDYNTKATCEKLQQEIRDEHRKG